MLGLAALAVPVGLLLASPDLLRAHVVQAFRVPSGTMVPTLLVGDHFLADKTLSAEDLRRGDVIVFRYPRDTTKNFVKRVVGLPGDTVEIVRKGLLINGEPVEEGYVLYGDPNAVEGRDAFGPIEVPAGALFVLGDNRGRSYDSRHWGFVPYGHLIGRAMFVYWSWDRENLGVRWSRIGKSLR